MCFLLNQCHSSNTYILFSKQLFRKTCESCMLLIVSTLLTYCEHYCFFSMPTLSTEKIDQVTTYIFQNQSCLFHANWKKIHYIYQLTKTDASPQQCQLRKIHYIYQLTKTDASPQPIYQSILYNLWQVHNVPDEIVHIFHIRVHIG